MTLTNITDANGNVQVKAGSFTKTDDTTGNVGEFNFDRNSTYSVATEWVEESTEIQALPDCQGFGNVYNLRQSIARDTSGELQDLVESFVAETNPQTRLSIVEQILYKWTGTESVSTTGRGTNYDGRKLAVLEAFMGHYFQNSSTSQPIFEAVNFLNSSFLNLEEMVYAQLATQTFLKNLYDKIEYYYDTDTNELKSDLSAVITQIQADITADETAGKKELVEFVKSVKSLNLKNSLDYQNKNIQIAA